MLQETKQSKIITYIKMLCKKRMPDYDTSMILDIQDIKNTTLPLSYVVADRQLLSILMYRLLYERDYSSLIYKETNDIKDLLDCPPFETLITLDIVLNKSAYIIYNNQITQEITNGRISGYELYELLRHNDDNLSVINIHNASYYKCINTTNNYESELHKYCESAINNMFKNNDFTALDNIVKSFAINNNDDICYFIVHMIIRDIWTFWKGIIDGININNGILVSLSGDTAAYFIPS